MISQENLLNPYLEFENLDFLNTYYDLKDETDYHSLNPIDISIKFRNSELCPINTPEKLSYFASIYEGFNKYNEKKIIEIINKNQENFRYSKLPLLQDTTFQVKTWYDKRIYEKEFSPNICLFILSILFFLFSSFGLVLCSISRTLFDLFMYILLLFFISIAYLFQSLTFYLNGDVNFRTKVEISIQIYDYFEELLQEYGKELSKYYDYYYFYYQYNFYLFLKYHLFIKSDK